METILVTGGTGGLGWPTVEQLNAPGRDVRVLSRKPGPGRYVGDLGTGSGLAAALDGVDTVLHLATSRGIKDSAQTRVLLSAARAADIRHIIYISIVGVEKIPYFYYRNKVECERLISESDIPWTILRATQFHHFVGGFFRSQRRLPALFSLDVPDQPIAVEEVAARLVELTGASPAGRVPDIGGPECLPLSELGRQWQLAHGTKKRQWTLHIPGKTIRPFQAGHHMTPLPGAGRKSFAEYAAEEAGR
ncbi:SDR family oxidoreductase [Arthrobacter sp. H14]|uniref:SDR family oxidoreductase n=1 Tax=Arthrobacter sp. H14 TaxID=1312959 RepID=UPI00047BED37|nr:NAD(P)H-binding protein [Arthrobacter sp. H14]